MERPRVVLAMRAARVGCGCGEMPIAVLSGARSVIARLRTAIARRRLQRIVTRNLASYETRRYAERRLAAKLGWQRRKVVP
jgi:hypothetical protein